MHEGVALVVIFLGAMALTGFLIFTYFRRKRDLIQARAQLQTRVLDRFDSPQEFTGFLNTEGGQRFLSGLTDERGWRPARRIVNGVSVGLVLVALSLAFFVIAMVQERTQIAYPGFITLALGLGFLAASFASYRMSKAWGLMNGDDDGFQRLGLDRPARTGLGGDASGGEL
ncbi:MAG TPA: hypothetical protein VKU40_01095 [Thermoanaerobaculia bacterium]|nr:hypothetical protein [Thermoanaerobaculia bacterium]